MPPEKTDMGGYTLTENASLATRNTLRVDARAKLLAELRDASKLPLEVTLTDAMAMTPATRLSSAATVEVSARISHDGQPMARPGDLEGSAGTVDTDRRTPVTLVIDKVHP